MFCIQLASEIYYLSDGDFPPTVYPCLGFILFFFFRITPSATMGNIDYLNTSPPFPALRNVLRLRDGNFHTLLERCTCFTVPQLNNVTVFNNYNLINEARSG